MRLLFTADTHVSMAPPGTGRITGARVRDLPAPLWRAIGEADLVIHAGDWVDEALLAEMERHAAALLAVHGNNDGPALRARLAEVARLTVYGLRLAVVHETGPAAGRERRCEERFPDVDVLVFGHSHIPWDSTTPGGMRLLNPGSPTDRRRQPHATYVTAQVMRGPDGRGTLADVVRHELPAGRAG